MFFRPSDENIYEKHIIPLLDYAKEGDRVLFVSPSAFFGFYSLGAHNFEEVCDKLKAVLVRKASIRLLIRIEDLLSAKAAEGLLSFLNDGTELKHLDGHTVHYSLLVYRIGGESRFVEFSSQKPFRARYLPSTEVLPYAHLRSGSSTENIDDAKASIEERNFEQIWDKSTKAAPVIRQFALDYRQLVKVARYQSLVQLIALLLLFVSGVMLISGVPVGERLINLVPWVVLPVVFGIVSNFVFYWAKSYVRRR